MFPHNTWEEQSPVLTHRNIREESKSQDESGDRDSTKGIKGENEKFEAPLGYIQNDLQDKNSGKNKTLEAALPRAAVPALTQNPG